MNLRKILKEHLRGWLPKEPNVPENRLRSMRKPIAIIFTATMLVTLISVFASYSFFSRPPAPPRPIVPAPTDASNSSSTDTSNASTSDSTSPSPSSSPTPESTPPPASSPTSTPTPPRSENMWNTTFGGTAYDYAYSIIQTSDGGYAVIGDSNSFGLGPTCAYLVKTNVSGYEQWNYTVLGSHAAVCGRSVIQTSDGGYAISGWAQVSTYYPPFDEPKNDTYSCAFLVKVNANGSRQWSQFYDGAGYDFGLNMINSSDGGFAIVGYTNSYGNGGNDAWLVKTDASGNIQWNKTYGGTNDEYGYSVVQTSDGGYAIVGSTNSFGGGGVDAYLVKTDATGEMQWNQTYRGAGTDVGNHIVQANDGGFTIAGWTNSSGAGNNDVWLIKTDASGKIQWTKTYGGTGADGAKSLIKTSDGGYAITGYTDFGGGGVDVYLVKTDALGVMQWTQAYGGPASDEGVSIVQTSDGGYAIAGYTTSYGAGGYDFWIIKTDSAGHTR